MSIVNLWYDKKNKTHCQNNTEYEPCIVIFEYLELNKLGKHMKNNHIFVVFECIQ